MTRSRRQQSGHNLLEVMIAALIFCSISVALTAIWKMHFEAMAKSRNLLVASYLGEQVMEECLAARFALVGTLYPPPPATQDYPMTTRTRAGTTNVIYKVMVTVTPSGPSEKNITVEVSWNGDGGANSTSFHTIMHSGG
jgi:Tfp pilus assembly protein PilV